MRALLFVFAFIISQSSHAGDAFTYHGISSGMTETEVNALTGCIEYCGALDYEESREFLGGDEKHPPGIWGMAFSYTSDGKLWRIQLSFIERGGPSGVAQRRVLTELYSDAELQKSTDRIGSTSIDLITAFMIDRGLFDADVDKIYESTIGKY